MDFVPDFDPEPFLRALRAAASQRLAEVPKLSGVVTRPSALRHRVQSAQASAILYWLDPFAPEDRAGVTLQGGAYVPLLPDASGRLAVPRLGLELGPRTGPYLGATTGWLGWMDLDGRLPPLREEVERNRAEAEKERADADKGRADAERVRAEAEGEGADAERRRADAAEAELARLRAQLEGTG